MYFKDDYFFMNNMYPCRIVLIYEGQRFWFSCVESAYQALKCKNIEDMFQFEELNGFQSKSLSKSVELKDNWNELKDSFMLSLLKMKFNDDHLLYKLKNVECNIIYEHNTPQESYWGVCNGVGLNHLGKLLMKVRDM